ncbi:MAG: hypothetical protein P4L41_04650 [Flavipsychrobacter sp.]|nr:hypothetical protein [Flavipsychrobacter sp.]
MKQLNYCILAMIAGLAFFTSCKKSSSTSVSGIQKQIGNLISSDTLCGGIKGTLQSGKTYVMTCPVVINSGDTVLMQSGATINVVNPQAFMLVQGSFISLGTKAAPNWITVKSIAKTDNLGTANNPSSDAAFTNANLWLGIQCDSSCPLLVLKWTHLEFAGGTFGATPPIASLSAGANAWPLYFKNANGYCIVEDSWLYGGTDDGVRFAGGKICFMRNTVEKEGYIGGDVFNAKHGTVGIMAYNVFVGTATNGTKASDKGTGSTPTCQIDMYNNTYVNGGYRQIQTGRGGDCNYEQGAYGQAYNNLIVNCKFGFRIVGNPAADTSRCHYGYNYSYGDADSIVNQFYPVGYISLPVTTNIPNPSTFLPSSYVLGATYTAHALVGANNPQFVNYPLPCPSGAVIDYATGYDFHLASGSPAIGKGYTGWTPMANPVPVDPTYGATTITGPGKDIGAYQTDGTGNQH